MSLSEEIQALEHLYRLNINAGECGVAQLLLKRDKVYFSTLLELAITMERNELRLIALEEAVAALERAVERLDSEVFAI